MGENYLEIVKKVLTELTQSDSHSEVEEAFSKTLTLIEHLYGKRDIRIEGLIDFKNKTLNAYPNNPSYRGVFKQRILGQLKGIQHDIENHLIISIEKQTIGSVLSDFHLLAKNIANENNKDVAAVLASAALEDTLKRFGTINGLSLEDKELSEVINALKSAQLLKGAQANVASGYIKLRNKAFHAEWDKIEMPEVKSLIAFLEEFILKNLS